MTSTVIFFDTETNGMSPRSSVLSISAIKRVFRGTKECMTAVHESSFERFYFRAEGEPPGEGAIRVNGLTDEVIARRRKGASYPRHFLDDVDAFLEFCADAGHFAAHNIAFDRRFLPFPLKHVFCTMEVNTKIVGLVRKDGQPKFPSLAETARFYKLDLSPERLHTSSYDTFLVAEIFNKMLLYEPARKKALRFLVKNAKPDTAEIPLFTM
jgi:DNA polymerase-3 subunit epsilon